MRKNIKKINNQDDDLSMKILKYSGIGIAILTVILVGLLIYFKNLNNEVKESILTGKETEKNINESSTFENLESASTEIGKRVNEVEIELNENNNISNNTNSNTNILMTNKVVENNTNNIITEHIEEQTEEKNMELNFEKPLEGEIVKEFATDNLIYSETLQEWTTHAGIDIKAEKTTIVKSSEAGTIKTIKNDPRYGLTIIIEHENGFQTVYSNLLTSEFVVEGEKVEKGQSIGTVGNTAAFEIADEAHLHFEILKDSIQVNPSIYLK